MKTKSKSKCPPYLKVGDRVKFNCRDFGLGTGVVTGFHHSSLYPTVPWLEVRIESVEGTTIFLPEQLVKIEGEQTLKHVLSKPNPKMLGLGDDALLLMNGVELSPDTVLPSGITLQVHWNREPFVSPVEKTKTKKGKK